jgi:hypothetical protein
MHGIKVKIKNLKSLQVFFPHDINQLFLNMLTHNITVNEPGFASQFSDSMGHIRGSISFKCEGFPFIMTCSPSLGHKIPNVVNAGLFTEGKVKGVKISHLS